MRFGWNIQTVTPPTVEPVSLELVKAQARLETDGDDALITELIIPAARARAEAYLRRALLPQTLRVTFDGWAWRPYEVADYLAIPVGPVTAITQVSYLDGDAVSQVVDPADYATDLDNEPARIFPAPGSAWPATAAAYGGTVSVTFVAGYVFGSPTVNAASVPPAIRHAIAMDCAHYLEHRETVSDIGQMVEVPHGWRALLEPYRLEV
jgi:uncharacterized phiE125 gp8 family phage protein